jgi:hypothetical protein
VAEKTEGIKYTSHSTQVQPCKRKCQSTQVHLTKEWVNHHYYNYFHQMPKEGLGGGGGWNYKKKKQHAGCKIFTAVLLTDKNIIHTTSVEARNLSHPLSQISLCKRCQKYHLQFRVHYFTQSTEDILTTACRKGALRTRLTEVHECKFAGYNDMSYVSISQSPR